MRLSRERITLHDRLKSWFPVLISSPPSSSPTKTLRRIPPSRKIPHLSVMPSPRKTSEQVVRRPAAEVVTEMSELARQDRARMTAPTPPAPRPPGRFWICRRPPLPPPINPRPPASPERQRGVRVAAVSAQEADEREGWLLKLAEEEAGRPRTPSPPRRDDDHYDLARWNRNRWR